MAEKQSISVKSMILYGLAIIVVAFIGVLAGNWFVQWRQASQDGPSLEDWQTYNQSTLLQGDVFPSEELLDLDSAAVDLVTVLQDPQPSILLFVAPGCKPCATAIDYWKQQAKDVPAGVRILGIAVGPVSDVREYVEKNDFPFPVYCDQEYLYPQQYDLSAFPSMVGLDRDRKVVFVMCGFFANKISLGDAGDFIMDADAAH